MQVPKLINRWSSFGVHLLKLLDLLFLEDGCSDLVDLVDVDDVLDVVVPEEEEEEEEEEE